MKYFHYIVGLSVNNLIYLDEKLSGGMKGEAVFPKTEQGEKLRNEYSEFVREIKANGVYDEMFARIL